MSVHHKDANAIKIWSREIASAGTGMGPGTMGLIGGRPKPTPIIRLASIFVDKEGVDSQIKVSTKGSFGGETPKSSRYFPQAHKKEERVEDIACVGFTQGMLDQSGTTNVPLRVLAVGRSGDKGNDCNIGIIARSPHLFEWINRELTVDRVQEYMKHTWDEESTAYISRYELPGFIAAFTKEKERKSDSFF